MARVREPTFTLHLLGTPRVEGPDGDVGLPLGKPLAALCYVVLEPSAVSRTDLGAVLWPSSPESRAKASIRQALWLIRRHTAPEALTEEEGTLRIDPTVLGTDLSAFESAMEADRLDDALTLWNGGLLHAFTIPDAQPWLTWAEDVRSRWEGRLGRALEARAARAVGEERVVWLDRALAVRPYRVDAWLDLLQARVDLRDVDGAAEALARLQQVADEDDADLVRDAEERLRLLRRAEFGDPGERLTPEFVGRSREFAALMTAWRSALSGRSRVMGLMGPAGIGKSALAAEALRHAEVDDALAVEVRGVRTEVTLDLGVAASLVSDLLRRPGAAGVGEGSLRILRTLVPSESDSVAPPPRAALVADALTDLLDAVSHEQPLVLLVDDAHWMDRPSALVLLRALRQVNSARVLMIWTCRVGSSLRTEAGSDAVTALRDAANQGSAAVLELSPLTEAEVAEMVALLLAEEDPERLSRLATRIHLASGGSPLHIVELLRGMQDRGLVGLDDEGRWVLAEDAPDQVVPLSETLEDTLAHRVRELSDGARALGRRLAQEAGPLSPEALGVNGEAPDPGAVRALAELLRRGLVRWTRDDRLEVAHGEVAEALKPRMGAGHDGEGSDGAPRPRLLPPIAAAATVIVLMVAAALWLRPEATPTERPYGGGTILLNGERAYYSVLVQEEGGLVPTTDTIPSPPGVAVQDGSFVNTYDGGWGFGGLSSGDPSRAPDAVFVLRGRTDTAFASPGDDVLLGLSPDLSAALVAVQNPDTARFRHMMVRVALSRSRDTAVLASGDASYRPRAWSPDGRWVLSMVDAPWDSVIIADPGGRRIASHPTPDRDVTTALFCGPDRVVLETTPPARLSARWLWDFRAGSMERLSPRYPPNQLPYCSPDGTALAYLANMDQRTLLVVETFEGNEVRTLDVTDMGVQKAFWVAPPTPAPSSAAIQGPIRPLARGERATLAVSVRDQRTRPIDRPAEWSSDDPTIASVTSGGLVIANRPGRTTIRATVDGWITDSAAVEVSDEALGGHIAVADSFPALDLQLWNPLGEPTPVSVRFEGRPALYLNGDGRFTDGITSRGTFDLGGGGTLEAVFRMDPFTRDDRNRIVLCLADADAGEAPENLALWTIRQQSCLTWPPGEGTDFDPGALGFHGSNGNLGPIPIDTLLAPGRWSRLSLQLRADGQVSAVVGDSVVAVHPIALVNDSTVRWRLIVAGASVDNQLLLRDLTLWLEERVPSGAPPSDPEGSG